ncbi:hypothetical protein [Streptomyces sp. NPDC018352]|uniref:hypothetical protein n=1 Tax=Streptomyces sp. NPDC018352 TaxID=3157194 RepID=UPI0033E2FBD0
MPSSAHLEVHNRIVVGAAQPSLRVVRLGDRVARLGPNHPASVETMLAMLRLGVLLLPLNRRLSARELNYQPDVGVAASSSPQGHGRPWIPPGSVTSWSRTWRGCPSRWMRLVITSVSFVSALSRTGSGKVRKYDARVGTALGPHSDSEQQIYMISKAMN